MKTMLIVVAVVVGAIVGMVLRRSTRLRCVGLAAMLLAGCSAIAQDLLLNNLQRNGAIISGGGTDAAEARRRAELIAKSNAVYRARQDAAAAIRWQKSATANGAKVLAWDRQRAERGEASGQYDLGMRYLSGRGVTNSPALGREWLAKAAAQGHAKAAAELARLGK